MNYFNKKLLIILVCFAITGTSFVYKDSKCQVMGYLFLKKEYYKRNTSNFLIIDEIRAPKIINHVIQDLKLSNINAQSLSPEDLIINLKVENYQSLEYTDIFKIKISYSHTDLNLAAEVINSVTTNYLEESLFQFKQKAAISKRLIEDDLARKKEQIRIVHNK